MLKEWNGKDLDYLKDLIEKGLVDKETSFDLLSTGDLLNIKAGVWFLKHFLERGVEFTPFERDLFLTVYKSVDYWQVRLMILQSLKYLDLKEGVLLALKSRILEDLESDNKFLRAWSYEGLYYLSRVSEADELFFEEKINEGFQRETGAVLARLRQILKKRDQDAKRASKK